MATAGIASTSASTRFSCSRQPSTTLVFNSHSGSLGPCSRVACVPGSAWTTGNPATSMDRCGCEGPRWTRRMHAAHALTATRRPLSSLLPSTPSPSKPEGGGGDRPTRRLILMRHADSASPRNVRDHDRPISDLGKQQAAEIAQVLLQRGWVPDIVLASNARRTRQTLDEMSQVMDALGDVDTHLYGSLYTVAALDGQTREHIEECLLEVVDDQRNFCVAVVGHNKGMEEAASQFAGEVVKLKTASVALLQGFADSWKDILSVAAGSSPEASGTTAPGVTAASAAAASPAVAMGSGQGSSEGGQGVLCDSPSKPKLGLGMSGALSGGGMRWQLVDVITPARATS